MNQVKRLIIRIPVQVRLWLKWLLFVSCLIGLIFTLTEINTRLIVAEKPSNHLFASWYGFRAFLAEGEDPYSIGMQGRIDEGANTEGISLEERETYLKQPMYGIVLYLPLLFIREFDIAFAWWLTLIEIAAVFVVILGVSFIKKDLKKNSAYVGLAGMLMLGSIAFYADILSGSTAIFAILILLASVKSIQSGGNELTGVLLALMTVFPFVGWISMLYILVWSVRQRRNKVLWWFLGTIVLLGFAVALLEPQWLILYLRMWVRYFEVVDSRFLFSILESVFPATFLLPGFLTGILIVILLAEWGFAHRKEFVLFYWAFSLTLLIEALLSIEIGLVNLIFAPITLIFLLVIWEDRWKQKGRIVGIFISLITIGFPWLLDSIMGERGPVQTLVLVSFSGILLLINLYWVRWWLLRSVLLRHSESYSLDRPGEGMGDA